MVDSKTARATATSAAATSMHSTASVNLSATKICSASRYLSSARLELNLCQATMEKALFLRASMVANAQVWSSVALDTAHLL